MFTLWVLWPPEEELCLSLLQLIGVIEALLSHVLDKTLSCKSTTQNEETSNKLKSLGLIMEACQKGISDFEAWEEWEVLSRIKTCYNLHIKTLEVENSSVTEDLGKWKEVGGKKWHVVYTHEREETLVWSNTYVGQLTREENAWLKIWIRNAKSNIQPIKNIRFTIQNISSNIQFI